MLRAHKKPVKDIVNEIAEGMTTSLKLLRIWLMNEHVLFSALIRFLMEYV